MTTSDEDIKAKQAARYAVKETFALLGVDVDSPSQIEEFRRDLRWAGDWRRATKKGMGAVVVGLCVGAAGIFWAGLRLKL